MSSDLVCMQAMGDNVVELVLEFSSALSRGEHSNSMEDKVVFWDFLGLVMVGSLPAVHLPAPHLAYNAVLLQC